MDNAERKELRKEIVKKLNRAKKLNSELKELLDGFNSLDDMIYAYFEDYEIDYSKYEDSGGWSTMTADCIRETMISFIEKGEHGGKELWDASDCNSGSEFMRNAEKWHKENAT